MHLTLGQAAKEVGRSKPTILNAINKGRISARKSETGAWEIDPAELFRVYDRVEPLNGEDGSDVSAPETPSQTPSSAPLEEGKAAALEAELKGLRDVLDQMRERLSDKDRELDDARKVRDDLMAQVRSQTALLTDMRSDAEKERATREEAEREVEAVKAPPRRGLARLFGRRAA